MIWFSSIDWHPLWASSYAIYTKKIHSYVLENYLKNFLCIYSITGRSQARPFTICAQTARRARASSPRLKALIITYARTNRRSFRSFIFLPSPAAPAPADAKEAHPAWIELHPLDQMACQVSRNISEGKCFLRLRLWVWPPLFVLFFFLRTVRNSKIIQTLRPVIWMCPVKSARVQFRSKRYCARLFRIIFAGKR